MEIKALEKRNEVLDEQLIAKIRDGDKLNQSSKQLQLQFQHFDASQYLVIESESQLRISLLKDIPDSKDIVLCIEYINTIKNYNRLIIEIDIIRAEFNKNDEALQQKKRVPPI